MAAFNGQLNANEIFSALYNMIISQEVFADNIAGTKSSLVDMSRVDGSLYGDTKLYYSPDVLKSVEWGNDAEAANLLAVDRPKAPECQKITIDQFRQIRLTVDNYLSKRAWSDEGAFASFTSVMLGMMSDTKRIYDSTTFNAFLGTSESSIGKQKIDVDVTTAVGDATGEEKARIEAGVIGEAIAKLLVDLEDVSRDYNDYGQMKSYNSSDLVFVWNTDAMAKIEKRDLPTIFHKEIIDKFGEYTLPGRYFGKVNASQSTGNGTTIRSLVEQDVTKSGSPNVHVFAGDLIPSGYIAAANTSYTVDNTILFKVIHKRSIPYMSAFEAGTSFFNPRALLENNYLTFGHNTLAYLKRYPMITVREK